MRPSWSMLALATAAAVSQTFAASAAWAVETNSATMIGDANAITSASTLLVAAADGSGQAWLQVRHWLGAGFERVPALMLGLSVLLAVPPLALAGLLVSRRKRHAPETTITRSRRFRRAAAAPRQTTARTYVSAWPTEAWVDIDGAPGGRCIIGRTLVRIGQEEDNDIRLSAYSVHRYHAVIRRTTDGDVVINDLSGTDGTGVLVNGARVSEARLAKGDVIDVGAIKLRFDAQPV